MQEELVTFETAKLAKEKGFDCYCHTAFLNTEMDEVENTEENSESNDFAYQQNHNLYSHRISQPTQSFLQKWLREVHKIEVHVMPAYDSIIYKIYSQEELDQIQNFCKRPYIEYWGTVNDNRDSAVDDDKDTYCCFGDTYEETLEKVIKEGLKLVKTEKYRL